MSVSVLPLAAPPLLGLLIPPSVRYLSGIWPDPACLTLGIESLTSACSEIDVILSIDRSHGGSDALNFSLIRDITRSRIPNPEGEVGEERQEEIFMVPFWDIANLDKDTLQVIHNQELHLETNFSSPLVEGDDSSLKTEEKSPENSRSLMQLMQKKTLGGGFAESVDYVVSFGEKYDYMSPRFRFSPRGSRRISAFSTAECGLQEVSYTAKTFFSPSEASAENNFPVELSFFSPLFFVLCLSYRASLDLLFSTTEYPIEKWRNAFEFVQHNLGIFGHRRSFCAKYSLVIIRLPVCAC